MTFIKSFAWAGGRQTSDVFSETYAWHQTSAEDADVLLLPGGADIDPKLYGEVPLAKIRWYPDIDKREIADYETARRRNIPLLGICRGAQLVHALNGGKLWQDINNHTRGQHFTTDLMTGNVYQTTSLHHQMMQVPEQLDQQIDNPPYQIIATASVSSRREDQHRTQICQPEHSFRNDIEVLYYPKIRSILYQGHPEYNRLQDNLYFSILLNRFGLISKETMKRVILELYPPRRQDEPEHKIAIH